MGHSVRAALLLMRKQAALCQVFHSFLCVTCGVFVQSRVTKAVHRVSQAAENERIYIAKFGGVTPRCIIAMNGDVKNERLKW